AAAELDLCVTGEEGSETEDLARLYHAHSPARLGRFVPCYARLLPQGRLVQELGRPGAGRDAPAVARARGGTLFVDAPDHLPEALQAELAELLLANRGGGAGPRPRIVVSSTSERGVLPGLEASL